MTTGDLAPILEESIADYSINSGGPDQRRHTPFHALSAFLEVKLGRYTFAELAFNHQEYSYESFDPVQSHRLFGDANPTLPGALGANPYSRGIFMETAWGRYLRDESSDTGRATLSTEFDAGKWAASGRCCWANTKRRASAA